MNVKDRARLTSLLQAHVAEVAADLRAQFQRPGPARQRAEALHKDERVGDDFDVWTDLLSRRAAVLWVLKSVYVRVLEDRGLINPGRILDPEGQQLFERLAPNLGETAFLRWVYRDLASKNGGLPELFGVQPAELAAPSDAVSRKLLQLWRHKDPDTGAQWSFANERFDGELMGDLYQELDPEVKDRFALCQTPDFVRGFILDRTLTPAIAEYGADAVRLLDPACGSGHFLIDGLKRLVAATREMAVAQGWDDQRLVAQCLDRVVGIDLNDYACALARARLVMTAAELAGVTTLADAARFHPHVYWADGLEQFEKAAEPDAAQLDLLDATKNEVPVGSLTRPVIRQKLREVLSPRFHAVVANPPYITEKDTARKTYHRKKVGTGPRYVSAYRQYSLGAPFTERCFQLAVREGYVGLITGNNFMKREFGRPLIEKVLAGLDLTLVVDTSQAYIPFHGTPTVLLFGRNRAPKGDTVRAVMGKRGETGTPDDPAKGRVWSSVEVGWAGVGFENEFVSVADVPRETLGKHPWSLQGGGASRVKRHLEDVCARTLGDLTTNIGRTTVCGEDPVYIMSPDAAARVGAEDLVVPLTIGEVVRDWSIAPSEFVLYPYVGMGGDVVSSAHPTVNGYFWRYRTLLRGRTVFGKTPEDRGAEWFEHLEHYAHRLRTPLSIAFAFVATHNHFVLDRGGKVFNRSAPVIKLPEGSTEDDHLALLGLLNSSVACFWMKQVFHPKTHASQKHHPDPARGVYEFAATGLQALPIPDLTAFRSRLVALSRRVDDCARKTAGLLDSARLETMVTESQSADALEEALSDRWRNFDALREQMVCLQEEIDWVAYVAYGLADASCLAPTSSYAALTCPRGDRPFERRTPRQSTVRMKKAVVPLADAEAPSVGALPSTAEELWARRVAAIEASAALQLVETPVHKRSWRDTDRNVPEPKYRADKDASDLAGWLADTMEDWARSRTQGFTLAHLSEQNTDPSIACETAAAVLEGWSGILETARQRRPLAPAWISEQKPEHGSNG